MLVSLKLCMIEEINDSVGFSHGEYAEIVIITSLLCSRNLVTSFALFDVQLSQTTARVFCYFSSPLPIESKRERRNVLEYFNIDCSFYDYRVVIPILGQRNNSTNSLWVRKLLDKSFWVYEALAVSFARLRIKCKFIDEDELSRSLLSRFSKHANFIIQFMLSVVVAFACILLSFL